MNSPSFTGNDVFDERLFIENEDGLKLEAILSYDPEASGGGCAVIFPPHPLFGGDMNNNVVEAVAGALARSGTAALRFNYRGVGDSECETPDLPIYEYWSALQERKDFSPACRDGIAVARFAAGRAPGGGLWLVGYSLGCIVAARALSTDGGPGPLVQGYAGIAMPVNEADFSGLANLERYLIVAAGRDALFPPEQTAAAFDSLGGNGRLAVIEESDHFFIGFETKVSDEVVAFIG